MLHRSHRWTFLLCFLLAAAAVGCDAVDDDDDALSYEADLQTIAANYDDDVNGEAEFEIGDETFEADVDVQGVTAGIAHAQHIHAGSRCPTAADDANGDGYVDVIEGAAAYGLILVPLDQDLAVQAEDAQAFPEAGDDGAYDYEASADLGAMLNNLRADDPDEDDAVIKLGPGENLDLITRHVVVHGVDPSTELPSTVQSLGNLPSQATLPVACGELSLDE